MNKEYFSVGDLAKLFNMTTQTLRFYDKMNLFKPAHINEKTSYRYYTTEQFEKLTMINYLRSLELSIEDIKDYYERDDLDLVHFFENEIKKTVDKIKNFNNVKMRLEEELIIAKNKEKFNTINVHYFKERLVAFRLLHSSSLQELHHGFEHMDKQYKHLENKCFGTIIGESNIHKEKYQFHSILLFVDTTEDILGIPYVLKEGDYICLVSTGGKCEQEKAFAHLLTYAKENNMEICGDGIFILLSHNHSKNSKVLFEIQLPIREKQK